MINTFDEDQILRSEGMCCKAVVALLCDVVLLRKRASLLEELRDVPMRLIFVLVSIIKKKNQNFEMKEKHSLFYNKESLKKLYIVLNYL